MLDPWSLRILVEVAERGSFSAAADALVLTQPAVSRQISGLEARLGVTLFRREPRGVTPTGGVELVTLLDEELDVALPEDHRLAGRPAIPLADVRDETWIEGAHPDYLGPLPELTKALGAPPRIGFTCHDWNGKQALVAGGAGIMLVPTLAREAIRPPLRLRPTTPRLPSRRLYAAVPRPPFRTPPADAMLALLSRLASTVDRPSA